MKPPVDLQTHHCASGVRLFAHSLKKKQKHLFIWLCRVLVVACGIKFSDQGLNLGFLLWEHRVFTTGPPGKSLLTFKSHFLHPCLLWRSNQSFPKEINPEYSLEGLMLKLQYLGHLMQRASTLEKTMIL